MTSISPKATREDLIAMIHNRDGLVSDLKTEIEKAISLNVDLQDQLNSTKRSLAHQAASRAKEAANLLKITRSAAELCNQLEAEQEHGGGADETDCPICEAIRDIRTLTQGFGNP